METCYDGALVMPCSYTVMSENEMQYLNGGENYNLGYHKLYITKPGSTAAAASVIGKMGWSIFLGYDLAAEIYCHAFAYYSVNLFLDMCSSLGFSTSSVKKSSFWKSLNNGIDLENHVDMNTICGVPRYIFYRKLYALAI